MHGIRIWAYCLMPNHIHLIAEPDDEKSLALGIAETHASYTRMINFRQKWRGYLWQGRFASFPMDDEYMLKCARYILLNPVRAKLVSKATGWKWSSIHEHLGGQAHPEFKIIDAERLADYVDDWDEFLVEGMSEKEMQDIRAHSRSCFPAGGEGFIRKLERKFKRRFRPAAPGRPRKKKTSL
jgi:putative transposase